MIKCDECGLEYLEWGRDEMCPRCKHKVKEIDTIESLIAERDELKKVIDAQIECDNEMMDDRDYWKRLAEAAGEVITYMEKSGMSIVPWNEIYKKYQSIKEGGK
jgi:hypothetical protein